MYERSRLAAVAVHRQRVADGGLDQKAIEYGAVVAVVVETVDELHVPSGLVGVRAPDDALVQIGDAQLVVLGVELEHELIQALGHVVDAAGVGGIQDFARCGAAVVEVDVHGEVAFGNRRADICVAVDAHGADVHEVRVERQLDECVENLVGGVDVVVDRVVLVPVALHRIGSRALLGQVQDGVGTQITEPTLQTRVVAGDIDAFETYIVSGKFPPDAPTLLNGVHRGQRLHPKFRIDPAPAQVVGDEHFEAEIGEVQRRWPPNEPVSP